MMRNAQPSPTRSRPRAIGHVMLPKLLRCIDVAYSRDYHDASHCLSLLEVETTRMSQTQPAPRSFWIPVLCGAVILTIGIGARQSFGIFQKPIAAELGVGRELWSFANALSMLLMG